jgi:hypothetical protein
MAQKTEENNPNLFHLDTYPQVVLRRADRNAEFAEQSLVTQIFLCKK